MKRNIALKGKKYLEKKLMENLIIWVVLLKIIKKISL
jgi:hypothetical protein